jgi:hypothetical protein
MTTASAPVMTLWAMTIAAPAIAPVAAAAPWMKPLTRAWCS